MRVMIGGLGKSGTSALYQTVRLAMPADTHCLFEPHEYRPTAAKHVLVKVLAHLDWSAYTEFDRPVLIVRDPRDRAVSGLLYSIYNHQQRISEDDQQKLVQLLEQKERDCRSVGLRQYAELLGQITGRHIQSSVSRERHVHAMQNFARFPHAHRIRYEDFVAGRTGALAEYLGLQLPHGVRVDPDLRRVERTRTSGDWQNWFTPDDVEYFRPLLAQPMRDFGYQDCWDLPAEQRVLPQHGSQYVRRILAEQAARVEAQLAPRRRSWRHRAQAALAAGFQRVAAPFRRLTGGGSNAA